MKGTRYKMTNQPICPICSGFIPNNETPGAYAGAISRTDNKTEICSACGNREALEDFADANPVMFVTPDGTYGDASEVKTFSTKHWTDDMYEEFYNSSDNDRWDLADHFSNPENHTFEIEQRHADGDSSNPLIPLNVCTECDLSPSQLFKDQD